MNEETLGDMISYWYFITMLYLPNLHTDRKTEKSKKMLSNILKNDAGIKSWFLSFILEARGFYKERSQVLQGISVEDI